MITSIFRDLILIFYDAPMELGDTMKKIILILSLVLLLSACGKKDNAENLSEVKGDNPISIGDVDSFIGAYDLIRMDTEDCGASLQIIKVCDGLQVRSNNLGNQSFCNINKGEIRTADNRSSTTNTYEDNILKSEIFIFDERSTPPGGVKEIFTNTLSIDANGNLLKLADLKTGKSSCLYQKR
jgi:hypothetical protein